MFAFRTPKSFFKFLSLYLVIALLGCSGPKLPPVDPYTGGANAEDFPSSSSSGISSSSLAYLPSVSFAPSDARYFDLVNGAFSLTPKEMALLEKNGFVVTDRLAFTDFTTAYAYVYWKDLPVVVTTDSILHAIHQTYDDLLILVEVQILTPRLITLLTQARDQVKLAAGQNRDPALDQAYADLEIYLTVPLALFSETDGAEYDTPGIGLYVQLAKAADRVQATGLFKNLKEVDFTTFKPRGHYTLIEELERYFRAVSWLSHIDFPVVTYSLSGEPALNIDALTAAVLLRDALLQSGQRSNWGEIDALLSALIGRSDNMTLDDLDRFLNDARIDSASDLAAHPALEQILQLLTTRDDGVQRITGQIVYTDADSAQPAARPISFLLFGQRFAVDSYLMSSLVFDRLLVDGQKVQRPFPSPLDVMYTLGNDRAGIHLQTELDRYQYATNLTALRSTVNSYDPAFWGGSVYNRWLDMLRKLNANPASQVSPQAMRTAAWADKMLHTQLASWAQLRHDNILYTKQSYTVVPLCEYPFGYVEPYPAFYAAVREYAVFGQALFDNIHPGDLTEDGRTTYQMAVAYFKNLESIAGQLQTLAEKELRLEPFTPDEERFLKSIAVRQLEEIDGGCTDVTVESWDGWYVDLFPWQDDTPALIADIHTNTNHSSDFPSLLPPGVLHIAAGPVAMLVFLADTDEGVTAYVGPTFTYFEDLEEGYPPKRLTDEEWDQRLQTTPRPSPPFWTNSFRIPSVAVPAYLELPEE